MSNPLISLVLPTKNSLPHLKQAIEGVRRQTYRNFELIVQDGGSTDGTLQYLATVTDLPRIDIISAPDSGIGQAYNRGIARSKGDLLCLIASDEFLFDRSLEMGVWWFHQNPQAAVIYGSMALVDKNGRERWRFIPRPFDLIEFMKCELFPTTGGLLNRKVIGDGLYYDETLKSCPDYDFWLRLGSRFSRKEIINRKELFFAARCDGVSMSYRPAAFEQFCKDKLFILDRFLGGEGNGPGLQALKNSAKAGIMLWVADALLGLEGSSPYAEALFKEAAAIDPRSRRFRDLLYFWRGSSKEFKELRDRYITQILAVDRASQLQQFLTRIYRSPVYRRLRARLIGRPKQVWTPK